jgi:5-methyltetrahydrofolate--homocysteine methyltransferase
MTTQNLSLLVEAIKTGKRKDAKALTQDLLDNQTPPQSILDALKTGMDDVGRRFKANDIFVPEVLVAARAMKTSMELLEPVLASSGIKPEFRVVIGTVDGDLHDIGKNLVAMMLKGSGFEVIDLGTNVSKDDFVAAIKTHNAQLVGLSALLTTTMPAMRDTVEAIKAEGLPVKVMVGGAPITQEFANDIQADGFSSDAASAVELARQLVGSAA